MPFDALLDPEVGRKPQRDAPALAELSRLILMRAPWLHDQPIETDANTWERAREEMVEVQKARGFPLAKAAIDQDNFLLRGIPVVVKDET